MNVVDKFLYKFIICLVLLVALLFLDKIKLINIESVKQDLSENFNILKVLKFVNTEKEVFIPLDITEEVTSSVSQTYMNYEVINCGKRVFLNDFQGVEVYKAGIVIKIFQNSDNSYQVTIKGIDDIEYVYDKLQTVDVNIYKIVKSGDILGKPKLANEKNYFDFFEVKYV